MTLIELLIVVSIIGLLISLAMPAVQQSREAARRMQCRNHLRQIGIALHNYESSHATFPPGETIPGWTFRALILPELDGQAIHNQLNFEIGGVAGVERAHGECSTDVWEMATSGRLKLLEVAVPVFYCPSDPRAGSPALNESNQLPGRWSLQERIGNYLGNAGSLAYGHATGQPLNWIVDWGGMFFYCSRIRPADVTDGLSHTLLLGERGVIPPRGLGSGESRDYCSTFSDAFIWNPIPTMPLDLKWLHETRGVYWSHHDGFSGANVCMGDGSVRFIRSGVAPAIAEALALRNDGYPIGEF
jgi:hypothetical protein